MRRAQVLFVAWLLTLLPAAGFVAFANRKDTQMAEFVRLASGHAEGKVVRIASRRGKRLRTFPIVEFTTQDGRRVSFQSRFEETAGPASTLFAKVAVVYVPAEPARAEIDEPRLHKNETAEMLKLWSVAVGFSTLVCLALAFRASRRPGLSPVRPVAPG